MGGKLHTKQKTETLKPRNEQHTFLSDCGGERESNSTDGRWGGERPITYGNGEKGLRRQYWSNDTAIPPGIGRIAVVPHSSSSSIVIESQGAEDNVRRIGAYRYKAKWEEPG